MKILFLTHTFPYPPNDGMKSTCYQLIKHLSARHDTTLLSLIESEEERKHIPEMKRWCKKVETVPHDIPRSAMKRAWNVIFDHRPFCVSQFYSESYARKLEELIASENFDLVHFLSINVSGYQHCIGNTPSVLFPHDSVSMQFYRNSQREPRFLRKIYTFTQWNKMEQYEKMMIPKFTGTVVVTEIDKKWIGEFLPKIPITVIPGGVDPDQFKPMEIQEDTRPPSVIFRGVMNFLPNVDAVLYFHSDILPLIRKEIPELRFIIVGKNPPAEIQKLHDGKQTVVTGLVEDIRPYMAQATVNICPMRIGSGMKNKILEPLSMERAIVATRLACDGIELEHEKHLLIADTPESYAKSVIELVRNPGLRKILGKNGRELAKKYTWAYSASLFENLYRGITSEKQDSSNQNSTLTRPVLAKA